ncbi:MAG: hypothetical protein FWG99_09460 [Treponema sp.]|nr:hypothetical protein [Treponema sp.]
MIDIRQLFLGGVELDLQTAYRKIEKKSNMKISISDVKTELDKYVSDGVLLLRYSIRDPYELTELETFDNLLVLNNYKQSKNHLRNDTTGKQFAFDECVLVEYYRLAKSEFIFPGLNPIISSLKIPCSIFGCDAISFSKKDTDDQVKIYKNLISILGECLSELGVNPNNTICIPSGDGYYIIFYEINDPLVVIKFSHAVQSKITDRALALPLRIGIETGTVFKIIHRNNQFNAIGHSLNSCSRIMGFGKEKHILVSKTFYEAFVNHSEMKNNFRDFGEYEDKHGYKIHIYNYSRDSVGNNDPICGSRNCASGYLLNSQIYQNER